MLDPLVKLFFPATACNMSASFVGRIPMEIATLIFDYAVDPVGPPVPASPTEWPRRIGTLPDGCTTQFITLFLLLFAGTLVDVVKPNPD